MPCATFDQPRGDLQTQSAESARDEIIAIGADRQRLCRWLEGMASQPRHVTIAASIGNLILSISRLNLVEQGPHRPRVVAWIQIHAGATQLDTLQSDGAPQARARPGDDPAG